MRTGHLEVQLVPASGHMTETPAGHVIAEKGQVYQIKITNHAPRRALVQIKIDGKFITGPSLVIFAYQTTYLERPIHATERGRFTVFAEGQTDVFGEDGGRDNPDLGVIEVSHQLEIEPVYKAYVSPYINNPQGPYPIFPSPYYHPNILFGHHTRPGIVLAGNVLRASDVSYSSDQALCSNDASPETSLEKSQAAGTGLTGHSDQNFAPVSMGDLESAITTLVLRLILDASFDWAAPRPLPSTPSTPARPPVRA